MSSMNLIGRTIGQFTILDEIGRGGMATVYSAMQNSMNRKVAIKILPPHFMHDPSFIDRFKREIDVISKLDHPHILPIFDVGEADGLPYIAMRYLGGGSMAQLIRRGDYNTEDIEKPFTQVCEALDYAHKQGIIHRDLKPGNIMLDESGNAYLSDFGIARVMGSNLTGSAIIGTPAYMSPEQAHGLQIDSRSDIYSLGVVLFELITGREPFQAETPMGLLLMHINEPLPALSEFRDDLPSGVQWVIDRATAKNPDERYSSAGAVAKAFSAALRGEAIDSTRPAQTKPRANVNRDGATIIGAPIPNDGGTLIASAGEASTASVGAARATIAAPTQEIGRDTGTGTGTYAPPTTGSRLGTYLGGAALVLVLILGGIFAVTQLMPDEDDNEPVVALIPTPFRSATTITTDRYSISVPQSWLPLNADFIDQSDVERTIHIWQAPDNTFFATLAQTEMTQADYIEKYYGVQEHLQWIDTAPAAENGTIRQSYRLTASSGSFGKGQLDVFFQQVGNTLFVLELYTADSIAAEPASVTTLQLILDSLRIQQGS